jgi:hypothetical protein
MQAAVPRPFRITLVEISSLSCFDKLHVTSA